ncbi:hypothetical protein H6P81_005105 [Aristolochia fimbriata]|uniref:Exostosin GT47 domain-containing protein n=1 Tax=Aristolochia fimbriata TaxID=158543 RepID=A0AAV7EWE5_ARIFI|nr:hypothetical protein H6P81_005105 [Aristolochia fimbriata]
MVPNRLEMGLRQICGNSRYYCWKLVLSLSLLTTAVALLLTYVIPYPLTIWFLSPSVTISLYKPLNETIQVESQSPLVVREQFPPASFSHSKSNISVSNIMVTDMGESGSVSGKKAPRKKRRRRNRRTDVGKGKSSQSIPDADESISYHTEIPALSLKPDEALLYAKRQIIDAPTVTDDTHLYGPIFRNISIFKRSYDLMEGILKIYIYPDGKPPIFHTPHLRGIYASEGWFMKSMEENRHFVVRDPKRAHLFYLPYSARQLQLALYVPDSHNMRPLSVFLKDYVNSIASKYPFWNRTKGSDHFLVACHDWGSYTLTEHEDLCLNTIKALCNADVSEGIFKAHQDVSLPETTIRTPKKPLRDIRGKPVSLRPILAFFAGNMHGRVRPVLLEHWGDKDPDMRIYGPLPNRVSRKMSYIQHMKSSKFCICPMGYEVNSPRIVEAIYYECVPVIIADNFVPPLDDVLDWSKFSVLVAEKDIPKLKDILLAIPLRRYISMQTGVKMVQQHFLWHHKPIKYDLFHMILHSIWFSRLSQIEISQQ